MIRYEVSEHFKGCQVSIGELTRNLCYVYILHFLSRLDYGCQIYASACQSELKKLDVVHNAGLRLCSGAFRTSPVGSIYVNCD